jgi:hypothetical protein
VGAIAFLLCGHSLFFVITILSLYHVSEIKQIINILMETWVYLNFSWAAPGGWAVVCHNQFITTINTVIIVINLHCALNVKNGSKM